MKTLDTITRRHTAFVYFADLVTNTDREYFPSLYCWRGNRADCIERLFLADAYDAEMKRRNDPRRAWRGTRPGPEVSPESDIEQALRQRKRSTWRSDLVFSRLSKPSRWRND